MPHCVNTTDRSSKGVDWMLNLTETSLLILTRTSKDVNRSIVPDEEKKKKPTCTVKWHVCQNKPDSPLSRHSGVPQEGISVCNAICNVIRAVRGVEVIKRGGPVHSVMLMRTGAARSLFKVADVKKTFSVLMSLPGSLTNTSGKQSLEESAWICWWPHKERQLLCLQLSSRWKID